MQKNPAPSAETYLPLFQLIAIFLGNTHKPSFLTIDDKFFTRCNKLGLAPLLSYLVDSNDLSDDSLVTSLNSIKLTSKFSTENISTALNQILDILADDFEQVVLLKGVGLYQNYYPEPFIRIMGDIDILIYNANDIQNVVKKLAASGFYQMSHNPSSFYETHHHLKPFYSKELDVWFELHTRLLPDKSAFGKLHAIQPDFLKTQLIAKSFAGKNVYILQPEINLLYIIIHWVSEFRISGNLIQFVDCCLILDKHAPEFDWPKFLSFIEQRNAATCVKLVLALITKNEICLLPKEHLRNLRKKKDSAGFIGMLILNYIVNGIVNNKFIVTRLIGVSNCEHIWQAYMRNNRPLVNLFLAAKFVLSPPNSKTEKAGIIARVIRLFQRIR